MNYSKYVFFFICSCFFGICKADSISDLLGGSQSEEKTHVKVDENIIEESTTDTSQEAFGKAPTIFEPVGKAAVDIIEDMANTPVEDIADTSSFCNEGDQCYELNSREAYRLNFTCILGPYTGQKMSVCGNEDGNWATGCGLSNIGAHHDENSHDAANKACGMGSWLR